MTHTTTDSAALVAEFTGVVGLDAVDARRAAFTALALNQGWTKSRIARYLGITRQRVNQKVDKLEHYAVFHGPEKVPVLFSLCPFSVPAVAGPMDDIVRYDADSWSDLAFADRLIDTLA